MEEGSGAAGSKCCGLAAVAESGVAVAGSDVDALGVSLVDDSKMYRLAGNKDRCGRVSGVGCRFVVVGFE